MTRAAHPDVLARIDAHCAAHGLSRSAFGENAVGDPRFVFDLEGGRECRRRTLQRVDDYMRTGRTWEDVKASLVTPNQVSPSEAS